MVRFRRLFFLCGICIPLASCTEQCPHGDASCAKDVDEDDDESALLMLRGGRSDPVQEVVEVDPNEVNEEFSSDFSSGGPGGSMSVAQESEIYGHPTPGKEYPKHDGFTLKLVEEFDEPIDFDNDPIWTYSDGGLSEGQVRFVRSGISFGGGKMNLTVRKQNVGGSCSHAEVNYVGSKKMSSGELRTKFNQFRYGRYEVRMKAPSVRPNDPKTDGNYIATMFCYRDAKFKHWREVDMEVTGDGKDYVTTNLLKADNQAYWKPSIQDLWEKHYKPADGKKFNARTDFHTYAFEWTPAGIKWFIDDLEIRDYPKDGKVGIPDMSGKIMMNLWIFTDASYGFGGKKGKNNKIDAEGHFHTEYDWFRFYKWDGDDTYPCANLDGKCLTKDDNYLASNNPCDGIPNVDYTGKKKKICKVECSSCGSVCSKKVATGGGGSKSSSSSKKKKHRRHHHHHHHHASLAESEAGDDFAADAGSFDEFLDENEDDEMNDEAEEEDGDEDAALLDEGEEDLEAEKEEET